MSVGYQVKQNLKSGDMENLDSVVVGGPGGIWADVLIQGGGVSTE